MNLMETRDVREQKRKMVGPILGLNEFDANYRCQGTKEEHGWPNIGS
jgi:hypothetical protein